MNLKSPHINLKGFIAANGITDYKTDPYVGTWEISNAFDLIPNDFYKKYVEADCKMSINNKQDNNNEPCPEMYKWLKQRMTEFNIYDLRTPQIMEIN